MSSRLGETKDEKLKEVQQVQLELLRKFVQLCEENNIAYYAVYGTLLGAERHKGFIPWDDDVDVAIWRKDAEKLKQIVKKSPIDSCDFVFSDEEKDFHCNVIKFQNRNTTSVNLHFFDPMGKYGIGIDVEIIDYTFSGYRLRKAKHSLLQFIYQLLYMKQYGETFFLLQNIAPKRKKRLKALSSRVKKNTLIKWMERVAGSHGFGKKCCSIYTYEQHHDLRSDWFRQSRKLPFEGMQISAPLHYTECLKSMYGEDYNQLPPENERVQKHLAGRYVDTRSSVAELVKGMADCMNVPPDKTFVMWGAGNMFRHFMEHFGEQCKPDFVVDNDSQKWGTERFGCPICSPDKIKEYSPEEIHLVICNIYAGEIAMQISEMGNYQHYIYWENYVDKYMARGKMRQ